MSREPIVERINTVGDAWRAVELQRLADGTALPLHHRASWAERMGEHWLLVGIALLGSAFFLAGLRRAWARTRGGG